MIIVSDTSPLMNLAIVGCLDLFERLYTQICVPQAVLEELESISPEYFNASAMREHSWIKTQRIMNRQLAEALLLELDAGEAEAIGLAMEIKAGLLLMDERRGRKIAGRFGLKTLGLLGVLIRAKQKGFISEIKPVLNDLLSKAGFWMDDKLYNRILQEAGEPK